MSNKRKESDRNKSWRRRPVSPRSRAEAIRPVNTNCWSARRSETREVSRVTRSVATPTATTAIMTTAVMTRMANSTSLALSQGRHRPLSR